MKARPIIFSGPMVRALLEGRKTQTRRHRSSPLAKCEVGDLLYVREGWVFINAQLDPAPEICVGYPADGDDMPTRPMIPVEHDVYERYADQLLTPRHGAKRPSIHMPRWASRLTLEVTDVRLHSLRDISLADCFAEGIPEPDEVRLPVTDAAVEALTNLGVYPECDPLEMFRRLWDGLHGDESFNADPEVVALAFSVHHQNVDELMKERT